MVDQFMETQFLELFLIEKKYFFNRKLSGLFKIRNLDKSVEYGKYPINEIFFSFKNHF